MTRMVYCRGCAAEIHETALACPKCGAQQQISTTTSNATGIIVFLLCFFLGFTGIHRLITGKTGTGLIMFVTAGGCFIWWLIDTIMIATGNYSDKSGKKVTL